MKILVLSASNAGSKSRIAADTVVGYLQTPERTENGDTIELLDLKEYQMTFSDGRHYLDYAGDNLAITQAVMAADVLFIVTPIFQASIPATLKNVFDLLPQDALLDKIAAIIVTAGSEKHFLVAEQQLKPILTYMKAVTQPKIVFIEDVDFFQGAIANEAIRYRLEQLVEDTLDLATVHHKYLEQKEARYDF